jgi:hypothetical protein
MFCIKLEESVAVISLMLSFLIAVNALSLTNIFVYILQFYTLKENHNHKIT